MSVFDKIMAVRQASFKDGEITLFNERVAIVPEESIIFITDYLIKNKDKIPEFYDGIRKSVYDGWANNIRKTYNFDKDPRKFVEWLINLGAFVGWGKHELIQFDSANLTGVLRTYNGPIAQHYKGKFNFPVDHFWRALIAGSSSAAFQRDMDWIEINCMSQGKEYCEFLFKPREKLTDEEKKKYSAQIPTGNPK